jgi:replicative DNA helicase
MAERRYSEQMLESLRIPPHSVQAEQSVLGGLMLDNQTWDVVVDRVGEEDFYRKDHRLIFRGIKQLAEKQAPFDVVTLSEVLEKFGWLDEAGGLAYLATLAKETPSAANIAAYADIVREKSVLRQLIHAGTEISDAGFHPENRELSRLLEDAEQKVFQIADQRRRGGSGFKPVRTLLTAAIDRIETLHQQEGTITGASTGFTDFDEMTSGLQPSDLIIVAGRPSMGKCLGKGTRVLMYSGELRKVEDLRIGDLLMGDDSTPRRILSLARGRENMYRIRQNKGIDYRVNESHILSLKRSREEGGHRHGELLNISVRDYLAQSDKFRSNYKGYKVAVEFQPRTLPIESYFVGLWLGDGNTADVRISTRDPEVVDYLAGYAERLGLVLREQSAEGKCPMYAITSGCRGGSQNEDDSLQRKLRELELLGNKHIPQAYLANATTQRLELLAGLIDSDGHYDVRCGGYEITQTDPRLARQIKFLCDTLGYRTSLIEKKASIRETGFEATVYRVRFFGDVDRIPVRIPRKQAKPWTCRRSWNQTGIAVEPEGLGEYFGFELDGNGLFLLEDMTVTHNTTFAMNIAEHVAVREQTPVAVFSMEMPGEQLAMRMMSSLGRIDQHRVRTGKLEDDEWPRMTSAINILAETRMFIDDTPALTPVEVRARCRRLAREHGQLGLVVLDYLQLMQGSGDSDNRTGEISEISRSLKALAKELHVPVVALSQLNRNLEQRPNKRPVPSDLRESGCLTGDTLITHALTGERIPIKVLAERAEQTPFPVFAVDENYKVGIHRMTKAFYSGRKTVYALKTRTGRVIKASANHPFLKLEGWRRLDELRPGDRIALPHRLETQSPADPLSDDELILLAHLLGDGCILPKQPYHYTSADWENIETVSSCAQRLFGIQGRTVRQENWWHLYLPSPQRLTHGRFHPITQWFEALKLSRVRSYEKRIPENLFRCRDNAIALFLKHLWATDGNLSEKALRGRKTSASIYYATSSRLLAEQVQSLLLRLGIQSVLREQVSGTSQRPMYHVHVEGCQEQLRFLKTVGCAGARGKIIPALIEKLGQIRGNPNYDVIPRQAWLLVVTPAKEAASLGWRQVCAGLNMSYCGSTLFRSGISRDRMLRLYGILPAPEILRLAESDVYWDEIAEIRELGVEDVYDATVEGVHNFVANDILVHNSIEQDADLIVFIYRDEVYNKESQDKGTAEIIIAKQRNGPIGTVRLTFLGQYTRFENFISNPYSDGEGF